MNVKEIEEKVALVNLRPGMEFIYDLMRAYEVPKASISRLRSGAYNTSDRYDELLWKGKVYYRSVAGEDDQLYDLIDSAKSEQRILKARPRFLIVRNEHRLLASDLKTAGALDIALNELADNATFFLPWAGIEKTEIDSLNFADIKAAEKMAKRAPRRQHVLQPQRTA